MKIGVHSLKWLLAFYNTDKNVLDMFLQIPEFANTEMELIKDDIYTYSFNFNKVVSKFTKKDFGFTRYDFLHKLDNIDALYHYGTPVNPPLFFKQLNGTPTFITTGFMTDEYMRSVHGYNMNRQKEADELAFNLDKAKLIHFHTIGGRERFLSYRPDFEEKTTSIPFFLPYLKTNDFQTINKNNGKTINILFVGYEGKRKGLNELIEALNVLGHSYLKSYNVKVTVVSKDKPQVNFEINWFKRLPHSKIMELMRLASIFILVPQRESYGLVLLEAMSNGCSVITDIDTTRQEILGDSGLYVKYGDINQMKKKLMLLIENAELRNELSQKAIERVNNNFVPEVVAEKYVNAFKGIIKK
jgi:glycosyltransferase involved in cell wall biosynthesis